MSCWQEGAGQAAAQAGAQSRRNHQSPLNTSSIHSSALCGGSFGYGSMHATSSALWEPSAPGALLCCPHPHRTCTANPRALASVVDSMSWSCPLQHVCSAMRKNIIIDRVRQNNAVDFNPSSDSHVCDYQSANEHTRVSVPSNCTLSTPDRIQLRIVAVASLTWLGSDIMQMLPWSAPRPPPCWLAT